ncbi:MAG: FG-GAP repeat protein [Planctomycetes bacterium]|nr:FG-GAP repeat protein [Planctomycetota bacterium]
MRTTISSATASLLLAALAVAQTAGGQALQVQKLIPGPPFGGGTFGHASALDGDLLAVGEPAFSRFAIVGRLSVFELTSASRLPRWSFSPDALVEGDFFGGELALRGDVLAVSAMNRDSGAPGSGAVWVFERTGETWDEAAYLTPTHPGIGAQFGHALALFGDTLLVGARSEDGSATQSGAVYVYRRLTSGWTLEARLVPADGGIDVKFGWDVALDRDRALVSAIDAFWGAQRNGALYEFTRSGSTWTQTDRWCDPLSEPGEHFGYSLSLDGDHLAIGASGNMSTSFGGRASVWRKTAAGWTAEGRLRVRDNQPGDYFACSVGLRGTTLVVGAAMHSEVSIQSGAAYVFRFDGNGWAPRGGLVPTDPNWAGGFGTSVALDGERVIVAAPHAHLPQNHYGAAYVFRWL